MEENDDGTRLPVSSGFCGLLSLARTTAAQDISVVLLSNPVKGKKDRA
jgi:hypothetical protein